jgi:hypothetical protein
MAAFFDAINPLDDIIGAVSDLIPGDNPLLDLTEDMIDLTDGSFPIISGIGNAVSNIGGGSKRGSTGGGGSCPAPTCYQVCQMKDKKAEEQAQLSIDNFKKTMKERGIIITGCKVQRKTKSCAVPKKTLYKKAVYKKPSCGCSR